MSGRRAIVFLLACLTFVAALVPAAPTAAQDRRRAAAFGIEVRQGRKPMPGVEVRIQSEGPVRGVAPAPQVTDAEGRAEFWWLVPGIWRVDLVVDGEVAYFLTVRLEGDRRAEEMGAPARDADAPDLRWKFFRPQGPPPSPPAPPAPPVASCAPKGEPQPRPKSAAAEPAVAEAPAVAKPQAVTEPEAVQEPPAMQEPEPAQALEAMQAPEPMPEPEARRLAEPDEAAGAAPAMEVPNEVT